MENGGNYQGKSDKQVLVEFVQEAFGYENGIVKTIKALKNQPADVVDAYIEERDQYVGPFRLLFAVLAIWLLINSFYLDWYTIWDNYLQIVSDFSIRLYDLQGKQIEKFNQIFDPFRRVFGRFFGDVYSKFFIPYVILQIPLASLIIKRLVKTPRLDLKRVLVVMSYSTVINSFMMFIMSLSFAIHIYVALAFVVIVLITSLTGYSFLAISPIRNFFPEHGRKIERYFTIGSLIASFIILGLFSLGYVF